MNPGGIIASLVVAIALFGGGFYQGWQWRTGDLDARIAATRAKVALERIQAKQKLAADLSAARSAAIKQETWDSAADAALAEQILKASRVTPTPTTPKCTIDGTIIDAMNRAIAPGGGGS